MLLCYKFLQQIRSIIHLRFNGIDFSAARHSLFFSCWKSCCYLLPDPLNLPSLHCPSKAFIFSQFLFSVSFSTICIPLPTLADSFQVYSVIHYFIKRTFRRYIFILSFLTISPRSVHFAIYPSVVDFLRSRIHTFSICGIVPI